MSPASAAPPRDAPRLATRAVHAGRVADGDTGAILTPIHQVATYQQRGLDEHEGYTYTRAANPTVAALEQRLASLDGGAGAVAFGSGMAAIDALLRATLGAGDHVVVGDVVYGGTVRLLRQVYARYGVTASFVDAGDPRAVAGAIGPRTRLVLVESPGNPTLKLADLEGCAEAARSHGVPLAVDNTFLTPLGQRVFDYGADVAVYSTTKYIEGHNATIGGALVVRGDGPAAGLLEPLQLVRKSAGGILGPFEAWLTLRGLKTLGVRLEAATRTAQRLAERLEAAPGVAKVHYPGLRSFPQRGLAARQQVLGGGVLAFELEGGLPAVRAFVKGLRHISLAESLGATETLLTHPTTMTHGALAPEEREALGITDGLLRLSVGLEDPRDLAEDLDTALARAGAVPAPTPDRTRPKGGEVRVAA